MYLKSKYFEQGVESPKIDFYSAKPALRRSYISLDINFRHICGVKRKLNSEFMTRKLNSEFI